MGKAFQCVSSRHGPQELLRDVFATDTRAPMAEVVQPGLGGEMDSMGAYQRPSIREKWIEKKRGNGWGNENTHRQHLGQENHPTFEAFFSPKKTTT